MKRWIFWLGLWSAAASAQVRYSNAFLEIGANARNMGAALGATVSDSTATYWNPANIALLRSPWHLQAFHMIHYGGIANYNVLMLRGRVDARSNAAVTYVRWGIDNIPNTMELIDATGRVRYENLLPFSAADNALLLAYARHWALQPYQWRRLNAHLSVGVQLKMIFRSVGTFARARGYGVDVGGKLTTDRWSIGMSVRDAGGTFNVWNYSFTEAQREVLAATGNRIPVRTVEVTRPALLLGGSYRWAFGKGEALEVVPELNLYMPFDGPAAPFGARTDVRMSVEVGYRRMVFVRGGLHRFQKISDPNTAEGRAIRVVSPAFGVGVSYDIFTVDYALADMGVASLLPVSHAVSLQVRLRPPASKAHEAASE